LSFSIKELNKISILENLPENLLSWLINNGKKIELSADEHMFKKDQPADFMFIVISGTIQRYEEIAGQLLVADIFSSGQATGMLPYSRMTHYPGPAVAKEASQVLRIHKSGFADMLAHSEEFGQRLIAEMSNRVRGGVRMEQQLEKMASLGRLAAGLAHEVNNPAAAIHRTAVVIKELFNKQVEYSLKISRSKIDDRDINEIEDYIRLIKETDKPKFSSLKRNELEEKFIDFLEDQSVEDPNLSGIFVESGINLKDLQDFAGRFPKENLSDALGLIAANIEVNNMLSEIINSAKGISELVSSIKIYSHMDQSLEHKPVDVRQGMDNTLKMLDYKLKRKKIQLTREYPENLPFVQGNAGQLNQVWTHLIDNAIDALDDGGKIQVRIQSTSLGIEVRVVDNGSGISDEIRDQIFDPFFTTKDIGEGTGLGLEISQRIIRAHRGQIEAQSKSGQTEMFVLLPGGVNK